MNKGETIYLGVDIGKTKIACGVFSEQIEPIDIKCYASKSNKEEILRVLEEALLSCLSRNDGIIKGIGIGTFGAVSPDEGIVLSSGTIRDWNMVPLRKYIEEKFNIPTFVENDVKAALLGEAAACPNHSTNSILYFSVGTSIGVAYLHDGMVIHGDNNKLGEIAHYIPVGMTNTLEEIIGGKGISQQYYTLTGTTSSCKKIWEFAMSGDPSAQTVFNRFTTVIINTIRWLEMCFDPSQFILGGGVMSNDAIVSTVISAYNSHFFKNGKKTNVLLTKAALGEYSGAFGAAALAKSKNQEKTVFRG